MIPSTWDWPTRVGQSTISLSSSAFRRAHTPSGTLPSIKVLSNVRVSVVRKSGGEKGRNLLAKLVTHFFLFLP